MSGPAVYRQLTPRRRDLGGYTQLWLAADHILLVRNYRLVEQYRRFYLHDIQAITVRGVRRWGAVVCAVLGGLISAPALYWWSLWPLLVFGVPLLLFPAWRRWRGGPGCLCYIRTAVSQELLEPVSRVRVAERVLRELEPAIEAVQGRLPEETLRELLASSAPLPAVALPAAPAPANVWLYRVLFLTFLITAAMVAGIARWPKAELVVIYPMLLFAEIGMALLVAGWRKGSPWLVRLISIVALVLLTVDLFGSVYLTVHGVNELVAAQRARRTVLPSLTEFPNFLPMALYAVAWRLVAAFAGLLATRQLPSPEAVPPPVAGVGA